MMTTTNLFAFLLINFGCLVEGHFNLYLNESETRRLLGVPGELYYARNGFINDYALSFNLPLKTELTDIYFNWQNELNPYLPEVTMFYNLSITVSNLHAMYQPVATIANNGTVPTRPSGFSIGLLCTGLLSTDVDVKIQLNVSVSPPSSNKIALEIRRKKPCLRGQHQIRTAPVPAPPAVFSQPRQQADDRQSLLNDDGVSKDNVDRDVQAVNDDEEMTSSRHTAFYVGVACALGSAIIIVVVVLIAYLSFRRLRYSKHAGIPINDKRLNSSDAPECLICEDKSDIVTNNSGLQSLRRDRIGIYCDEFPALSDIRIEPCRLELQEILIQGAYSCICKGLMIVGANELEEKNVFVKMITAGSGDRDRTDRMIQDGCVLLGLQHENINPIIAACINSNNRPLLIYPYMNEGNLKIFLQGRRSSGHALTIEQLMCMAIQLTAAIQFLHRRQMIHMDIATRNCLVDSCLTVRLGDGALSRDLFPGDYDYTGCYSNPGIYETLSRPSKWLAVESLSDDEYSSSSDVWSFGVTVWELVTLGQQPYSHVDSTEMLTYLRNGYRLSQPPGCPIELYSLLTQCWLNDPLNRPNISQLNSSLHNICISFARLK